MASAAAPRPSARQGSVSGPKKPMASAPIAQASASSSRGNSRRTGAGAAAAAPGGSSGKGCGSKPARRIAASAGGSAARSASMASVRAASWNCRPRMPAMPATAARISDSSAAQSIDAMRKRVPAAGAGAAAVRGAAQQAPSA